MNRWRQWVILVSSFSSRSVLQRRRRSGGTPAWSSSAKPTAGRQGIRSPLESISAPPRMHRRRGNLSAGRNEFEPFQIFIAAASSALSQVNVTITDLSDGRGNVIAALANGRPKNIVIYREHYLPVTSTSSSEGKLGLWPDGLVPKVDEYFGEVRRMPGRPRRPFRLTSPRIRSRGSGSICMFRRGPPPASTGDGPGDDRERRRRHNSDPADGPQF